MRDYIQPSARKIGDQQEDAVAHISPHIFYVAQRQRGGCKGCTGAVAASLLLPLFLLPSAAGEGSSRRAMRGSRRPVLTAAPPVFPRGVVTRCVAARSSYPARVSRDTG